MPRLGRTRPARAYKILPKLLTALAPAAHSGQPFIPGVFGAGSYATVEWSPGADLSADPTTWTWVDITTDVYYPAGVSASVGRADETSQASAAQCSLTLVNDGGKYTPWNANSTNWPNVKRNTPLRVLLDLGAGSTTVWQGYIASYAPRWDTAARLPLCDIGAAGSIQRLTQGKTPLRSPLYRAISAIAPVAWWSMEDGQDSTSAATAVTGQSALTATGSVAFGATGPAGAVSAVDFSGGGSLAAGVKSATTGSFRVVFAAQLPNLSTDRFAVRVVTSSGLLIDIALEAASSGTFAIFVTDTTGGGGTYAPLFLGAVTDTNWHLWQVTFVQSGGNVDMEIWRDGTSLGTDTGGTFTLGKITSITLNPLGSTSLLVTSVAVVSPSVMAPSDVTTTGTAIDGYTGETASDRITRLCGEQSVAVTVTGSSSTTMGPQPIAAFVDILRECESTDGGLLYDGRGAGLGYICRQSRYNLTAALTVDASAGHLSATPAPVDDDQRNRNDYTASRSGGSSATYTDSTGTQGTTAIGVYDTSVQVNTDTDDPLIHIAEWGVHLGTVEGLRWPNFTLDLAAASSLAQNWLDAGDLSFRVDLDNLASVADAAPPGTVRLIVEGWAMAFDTRRWVVVANASSFDPWVVGVLEDATNPLRLDGDGSAINTDAGSSATSLSIKTTSGPLWTTTATNPGDFPFDVWDTTTGEAMTVTAIVGASSPQTFTVTRAINGVTGKGVTANDPIRLYKPPVLAL